MTSKIDATYQRSIVLSDEDDNPIVNLEHRPGDKFIFIGDWINDTDHILSLFPKNPIIEIKQLKLSENGDIEYEANIIYPKEGKFPSWVVDDSFLKTHWRKIEHTRFLNLDDE